MVTIENADKVLKDVYLDVLSKQLNFKTNAFYNMIHKGSEDVQSNTAYVVGRYGINGGISSPGETDDLPTPSGNNFLKFRADMRNIYGTIEISDKVLRATASSPNSLVNVLNSEMEGLLEAAKFNFARMLFQDGSGTLAVVDDMTKEGLSINDISVYSVKNVIEGMLIDVQSPDGTKKIEGTKILSVDRANKEIKTLVFPNEFGLENGDIITLQDSYESEIYGLPYLFDNDLQTMYGTIRSGNHFMHPTIKESASITSDLIQETLDTIEEASGNDINLIICSYDVRRAYFEHLSEIKRNIDYMNLDGGFKALSYNGIPVVADRFAPDKNMYFVNTNDFKLAQLSDWSWIEGIQGKVLRQIDNKAAYTATLVKYANLLCDKPIGQGQIKLSS